MCWIESEKCRIATKSIELIQLNGTPHELFKTNKRTLYEKSNIVNGLCYDD